MPTGTTEVDFGVGGAWEAERAVSGQVSFVAASSKVEAYMMAVSSPDHSADEHRVETIAAVPGALIDSVGFTVYAKSTGKRPLFGRWTIQWVWV